MIIQKGFFKLSSTNRAIIDCPSSLITFGRVIPSEPSGSQHIEINVSLVHIRDKVTLR